MTENVRLLSYPSHTCSIHFAALPSSLSSTLRHWTPTIPVHGYNLRPMHCRRCSSTCCDTPYTPAYARTISPCTIIPAILEQPCRSVTSTTEMLGEERGRSREPVSSLPPWYSYTMHCRTHPASLLYMSSVKPFHGATTRFAGFVSNPACRSALYSFARFSSCMRAFSSRRRRTAR
jgi:hypothetical protein